MRHAPQVLANVLPALREALQREPGVAFGLLHGSAAEGLPFQDLDLALWLDDLPEDPLEYILDLGARLERHLGLPCDVHLLNEAPPGFAYNASRGRVLTARDPEQVAHWRENVWTRYFSFEPLLRRHTRDLLGLTEA